MKKQDYVLGFLFSTDKKWVTLIQKLRPEWQRGWYNGLGGKVEPDETNEDAMRREFEEEAGVDCSKLEWAQFATMRGELGVVTCFVAFSDEPTRSMTDEPVSRWSVEKLGTCPLIGGLDWLVPLARDRQVNPIDFVIDGSGSAGKGDA